MSDSQIKARAKEYAGKRSYVGNSPGEQKVNFQRTVNAFVAGYHVGITEGLNLHAAYEAELARIERQASEARQRYYTLCQKEFEIVGKKEEEG